MSTLGPHDQRHADRAAKGCHLILLALKIGGGLDGAMSLDGLARFARAHGLEANSNDTQVWCAMLTTRGQIEVVSRAGPVRYALTRESQ